MATESSAAEMPTSNLAARQWLRAHADTIGIAAILVAGAILRFVGLNWDESHYLHPDERFVTMVATGIHWPGSLGAYFDSSTSSLNPYNNDYGTFIYGTFPLFLEKAVADLAGKSFYGEFHLVARTISALFDLATVLLVYLLGRRLFGVSVGLLAALFSSLTVLQIQLSHFGTFDTFVTTLCLACVYFAVRADDTGRWWEYVLAGTAGGLAVASKLSAMPILAVLALPLYERARLHGVRAALGRSPGQSLPPVLGLLLAFACTVWTFRFTQPYAFLGPSPFSFRLDPRWSEDVRHWREVSAGRGNDPPSVQWAGRAPVLYVVKNLVLWGLGPLLGLTALAALGLAGLRIAAARRFPPGWQLVLVGWPLFHVLYYGTGFIKATRYLTPAYPFLALLAAALLLHIWSLRPAGDRPRSLLYAAPLLAVVIATTWYAIAFAGIYTRTSTRIAASEWIYANVAPGTTVLSEHWDDPLPLLLPGEPVDAYNGEQLDLYNDDNIDKLDKMIDQLTRAEYIFVSSNRLLGSIPRIPERYPMTIRYYDLLLSGELGFEEVKTFQSRPTLLGIELDDDHADESFTVYDHPTVRIFRKTPAFDPVKVDEQLYQALQAQPIVNLTPLQTGKHFLMFEDAERQVQQAGGTWSDIFDRDDLVNRHPVRVWYLALQLMALLAVPLAWRLLPGLPDRGYALAKTLGLLLVGYLAWLMASLRLMAFGRPPVLTGLAIVGVLSVALVWRQRRAFARDLRSRWREIVAVEALFLVAFFVWVWFRSVNPDLWHPYRGGEKPMEFAYFNAVIRSTHFPPYDPWFAGGYINYYYLGYALIAAVVRLTGIVPSVAFNLAVPTLFALLVVNTWSVVANALRLMHARWRDPRCLRPLLLGLLGPLFVVVLGNVDLASRVGRGELGYGSEAQTRGFAFGAIGDAIRGVWRMLTAYRPLDSDAFWPSTRVIPETVNEFPYFTYLFADFHPHMAGLTVTTAALSVALAILAARRWPPAPAAPPEGAQLFARPAGFRPALRSIPRGLTAERAGLVALAAFVTGTLFPLNAWDFPTYALIIVAAFALLELLSPRTDTTPGRWAVTWAGVRRIAIWSAATVIIGRVLYLPYFVHYQQPNSGFDPWTGAKTLPGQYLTIHIIPLFFVVSFLLAELRRIAPGWKIPMVELSRIAWNDTPRPDGTRTLGLSVPLSARALTLVPVTVVTGLLVCGLLLSWLTDALPVLLAVLIVPVLLVAWYRRHEPISLALAGMAGLALALSLAVERYTLRGDIGRFNTVFKFYLQVWVLLGIVAAVGLAILLAHDRHALSPLSRASWGMVAALLLLGGLTYPVFATPARLRDRFEELPRNLDGMAYMHYAEYSESPHDGDELVTYSLGTDKAAIDWLLDNVQGSPVILEAVTPLYRWGSRISVNTGLPTVIGWDWHQTQQRPGYRALIDQRLSDVELMYGEEAAFADIRPLLDQYHVRYIYVGQVERAYYPAAGLRKFDLAAETGELTVVYQTPDVTIYRYDGS